MKKLSKINILLYLQDEGSSNFLLHYIASLNLNKNYFFIIILNTNIMNKKKIIHQFIKNYKIIMIGANFTKLFFKKIIFQYSIRFVYSTFAQHKIDRSNLNLLLLDSNIKIFTFLDSWKNIERFNLLKKNKYFIGVINSYQKNILIKKFKNTYVVGHPELSKIKRFYQIKNNKILFVSDPNPKNNFKSFFFKKIYKTYFIEYLLDHFKKQFPNHKFYFRYHPKDLKIYDSFLKNKGIIIDRSSESISLNKFYIMVGLEAMYLYKGILQGKKIFFLKKKYLNQNKFSIHDLIYQIKITKIRQEVKMNIMKNKKINKTFINI